MPGATSIRDPGKKYGLIRSSHMAESNPSVRELLTRAVALLHGDSARLDAEVLLAACLGRPRSYLHAWPEHIVGDAALAQYTDWIHRRAAGEPVAHLTGLREFWSLSLTVTPDTLIPRPETETLVELALDRIPPGRPCRVADLGTGSGAIALAVASERPHCEVIATDISAAALAAARSSAERLAIGNVEFRAGHWCEPLTAPAFDLIVSNPPYIEPDDPHLSAGDVRFEPRRALVAGGNGMDELEQIASCAIEHLQPGGWLAVEHGYDQGDRTLRLLRSTGYIEVSDHTDTAGLSRVTLGRRPGL
jgi:release factor glutamine methyltransferase